MAKSVEETIRQLRELRARRLPILVGNTIVSFALDNFELQGFDTGRGVRRWRDRADGARPGGSVLVGKQGGTLRRSIRRTETSPTRVRVGSDVIYAGIHNEGGQITVSVTAKSRRYFWAMYYETGLDKFKAMALTKEKILTIDMPERRFLGPSQELDKRIRQVIEQELKKCF